MIIDFHTHVFPDNLADKALDVLTSSNNPYTPVHEGKVSGLLRNMDSWQIDVSVILPVITKLSQTKKTNEWAASICSDRLICFGGIYPHTDDYKRDIDFVVDLGLKGLKFHAEYQDFRADDERMIEIYKYALDKGLIILHHGGYDPAYSAPFRSSPQMFARVAEKVKGGVFIIAHLGGHDQWVDTEKYLAGSDFYFDTSMGFEFFPHDLFLRIVEKHGADKILFASDSPWSNAKTEIEHLMSLPISNEALLSILSLNAMRILNLD